MDPIQIDETMLYQVVGELYIRCLAQQARLRETEATLARTLAVPTDEPESSPRLLRSPEAPPHAFPPGYPGFGPDAPGPLA